mgnify:CR=1 FL=1
MGNILDQIVDAATSEIEAGGFSWRLMSIASKDLARVGHASLLVAQAFKGAEGLVDEPKTNGKGKSRKKAEKAESDDSGIPEGFLDRVTGEGLEQMAILKSAVVMAGTVAVGHDGIWEECQIVETRPEQNPDKGRIWIGSLPPGTDDALFAEVMRLSTDAGASISRIAKFRGRAGSSPAT